jgi:hypothetical protein
MNDFFDRQHGEADDFVSGAARGYGVAAAQAVEKLLMRLETELGG